MKQTNIYANDDEETEVTEEDMDYFDKATIDQIIQSYEEYKVLANRIMSEYCENERDWSISCLNVRFEYLATNNEEQWLFTALT